MSKVFAVTVVVLMVAAAGFRPVQAETTAAPALPTTAPPGDALPQLFNLANTGSLANLSAVCAGPVLNQGYCGSCYAFSSSLVFGVSACMLLGAQELPTLSPQFTLGVQSIQNCEACSTPCNGGFPEETMNYLAGQNLVSTCDQACQQGCLPYAEGNCQDDASSLGSTTCPAMGVGCTSGQPTSVTSGQLVAIYLGDFWFMPLQSLKSEVQSWLMTNGPVGITIDACDDFITYFNSYTTMFEEYVSDFAQLNLQPNPVLPFVGNCNASSTDHAVTIVGWYDVTVDDSGDTYWIVQNSWGTDCGDSGFFYISNNALLQGPSAAGYMTVLSVSGITKVATNSDSTTPAPTMATTVASDTTTTASGSGSGSGAGSSPRSGSLATRRRAGGWNNIEVGSSSIASAVSSYISSYNNHVQGNTSSVDSVLQQALSTVIGVYSSIETATVVNAQRKVVAGALYRIKTRATMKNGAPDELHDIVMLREVSPNTTPQFRILSVSTQPAASSSSSSSSSSRAGLIAGVTVAAVFVVAMALSAFYYTKVVKARAANSLSQRLVAENPDTEI